MLNISASLAKTDKARFMEKINSYYRGLDPDGMQRLYSIYVLIAKLGASSIYTSGFIDPKTLSKLELLSAKLRDLYFRVKAGQTKIEDALASLEIQLAESILDRLDRISSTAFDSKEGVVRGK